MKAGTLMVFAFLCGILISIAVLKLVQGTDPPIMFFFDGLVVGVITVFFFVALCFARREE